jgi:hypothetical protein
MVQYGAVEVPGPLGEHDALALLTKNSAARAGDVNAALRVSRLARAATNLAGPCVDAILMALCLQSR